MTSSFNFCPKIPMSATFNAQEQYFTELAKDRADSAKTLSKPSIRGVQRSVVEKYSDQAHFIYELLQNADDARATSAIFELKADRLIFTHNGTRYFSVSNPATEDEDSANGNLGDINAITSIANSNKPAVSIGKFGVGFKKEGELSTEETAVSIGKFGVGFKAVFQYTKTPHIYDPLFRFKIENFIVPVKIDNDFSNRKTNETVFVFPFDHPDRKPEEAFADIKDKLRTLAFPVLFLTNLKEIDYFGDESGSYKKSVIENRNFDSTTAQKITISNNENTETLWLFTRKNETEHNYSVGYFLDEKGVLKPVKFSAFCFFPTKETTELNFIVHAPFLLTDSREGIQAGKPHNREMIAALAELAADTLVYLKDIGLKSGMRLIDDNIVKIIPCDVSKFNEVDDKSKISFKPFYDKIKEKFKTKEILPTKNGYTTADNAYFADDLAISNLFSDEQLGDLLGKKDAQWVFPTFRRNSDKGIADYIEALIDGNNAVLDGNGIINTITKKFIEAQPIEWFYSFYRWIAEAKTRVNLVRQKPILLNQDKKAVAAFDTANNLILFLPVEGISGYETVHSSLLQNKETEEFIKRLEIREPSKQDVIKKLITQYKNQPDSITGLTFSRFFEYYHECPQNKTTKYIHDISDIPFIEFTTKTTEDSKDVLYCKASEIYLPSEELQEYFKTKPDTKFVLLDDYKKLVGEKDYEQLVKFLTALGVAKLPRICERKLSYEEAYKIKPSWSRSTQHQIWTDCYIDGYEQIIKNIIPEKSVILWNMLLHIINATVLPSQNSCSRKTFANLMHGKYDYFYYTWYIESFDSSETKRLRECKWLLNADGELVSASELTLQTLSRQYDITSAAARELIGFLGIKEAVPINNLTDEQRKKIEGGEAYEELMEGLTEEEKKEFKEKAKELKEVLFPQKRAKKLAKQNSNKVSTVEEETVEEEYGDNDTNETPITRITREVSKQAVKHAEKIRKEKTFTPFIKDDTESSVSEEEEDDFTRPPVDFSKKIEKAKERSAKELAELETIEELTRQAENAEKYSYVWFKALLKLEQINSGEQKANSKEISISFAKAEREAGTQRTVVLKHPNRYIPQYMEDLADIPLVLRWADGTEKKVPVEVCSVQSYLLKIKLKTGAEIDGVDLSQVKEASITAKNPAFLLEALRREFEKLGEDFGLEDDYDMQNNLCKNIEFVFGPPGTGKTTHLAKEVILSLMQKNEAIKVLVLTPTNKAADVLVRRIMEVSENDESYKNYLVRFGTTNDSEIENSGVFRDKTFDIRRLPRNVTVTTIARFPYDFFMPEGDRLYLQALKWDYIIIDEASMIPLINIIYPLYKKTPQKFIIAGDPFQIEPITAVDLWKDENIYTMIKLDSFNNPVTVPYQYPVKLLTTQYRSIPVIGEVFSKLTYGGVLQHHRQADTQRPLPISRFIDVKALNIIKFPTSKYESIYRPKRLQSKSNYHIYSALFTVEFIKYISTLLDKVNTAETFRIGIISPYRTQADLLDKLILQSKLTYKIDVQVGTIHGFQGDECDIIFALFNPPPFISSSKDMFLNKRNIINVSISRARDYLFMIMPDDKTENIHNLELIKQIETLCKDSQPNCLELHTETIELQMFGNPYYIEENAFSTAHQLVNVYGLPEKRYEIRFEDNAVDVQIHDANG